MRTFWFLIVIQLLICLVLATVDFGFDRPGQFGLDYEHFLLLLAIQAVAWSASLAIALFRKRWKLLWVSLGILILTLATSGFLGTLACVCLGRGS